MTCQTIVQSLFCAFSYPGKSSRHAIRISALLNVTSVKHPFLLYMACCLYYFRYLDFSIHIGRLHTFIGIIQLDWFRSYLSDWTQSVDSDGSHSDSPSRYWVPQATVIRSFIFRIYLLPLRLLLRRLRLSLHSYADDVKNVADSYLKLPPGGTEYLAPMLPISKSQR